MAIKGLSKPVCANYTAVGNAVTYSDAYAADKAKRYGIKILIGFKNGVENPGFYPASTLEATPIKVPRVSNKSTNMKESMIVMKLKVKIALKSSCIKVGAKRVSEPFMFL